MKENYEQIKIEYEKLKDDIEQNDIKMKLLLEDRKIKGFYEFLKRTEQLKEKLDKLSIEYEMIKMEECEHIYVTTDVIKERNYRHIKTPIYHCIKCGLTNKYKFTETPQEALNYIEKNMFSIYCRTQNNAYWIKNETTCSLETAKKIYESIIERYPNIDRHILIKYFNVALSDLEYQEKRKKLTTETK